MISVLLVFLVIGLGLVAFGARLRRRAFAVAALAPVSALVWLIPRLDEITDGVVYNDHATWVHQLGLAIDLRMDAMGATMTLIVAVIGVLVFGYSMSYFTDATRDLGRLAGLLVLFAGGMLGIVQADNLFFLYTCWEITTITSYFLIGNIHTEARARGAALHALMVTGAGGLAMFGGFVLLGQAAGTYRVSEILAGPLPQGASVSAAAILILFGAFTKSAQYPFHAWLPGAMEAPTPVSAYLHSATMVKAGVYLIARLAPLLSELSLWRPLVVGVGLVTLIAGGLRAMRQTDLKLLLAHGTVSQLGFMVVLFGVGTPAATRAGWMLLIAHAAFKATLFMVVGILDHQTGTRSLGELPALYGRWRIVEITAALAAASMAGVPLLEGFVAKESAYAAFINGDLSGETIILVGIVGGSMLTVAYALRFFAGAFREPRRRNRAPSRGPVADPTWRFVVPAALLSGVGVLLGVAPGLVDRFAARAASALGLGDPTLHLTLWHGFNLPLALSAVTLGGGVLVVLANRQIQPVLAFGGHTPTGDDAYLVSLRALATTARKVTGVVQNGSLPIYLGVILATAAWLPIGAFALNWDWPGLPAFGTVAELVVAVVLVTAAIGAAVIRQRFSAAVFLSVAGYAMAALFVVYSAPDLALTQAAVETLSTVVFVLVLSRLPHRWERQSSPQRRTIRLFTSISVGVMVFLFAILASGASLHAPVSTEMIERALPDGHGHNVVNVILVDFRGMDTMGEITVLAVAAIGAVAIARSGRRRPTRPDDPGVLAIAEADASRRIVFVDVSVQVIFHAIIIASMWLLFAGHNLPGGGFVGGLLAGSAFTLRYIAGGITAVKGRSRVPAWTVLGSGVLLAAITAAAPLAFGEPVLKIASADLDLPLFGETALSSALAFDFGVYLVVLGMVLMAFEAFGDKPEQVVS